MHVEKGREEANKVSMSDASLSKIYNILVCFQLTFSSDLPGYLDRKR